MTTPTTATTTTTTATVLSAPSTPAAAAAEAGETPDVKGTVFADPANFSIKHPLQSKYATQKDEKEKCDFFFAFFFSLR